MTKKRSGKLEIEPLVSVGPIHLEYERVEIHELLGKPDKSFGKGTKAKPYTDFWEAHVALAGHGIKVSYEGEDIEIVEVVDFPKHEVEVFGIPVLALPAEEVVKLLTKRAPYWKGDPEVPHSFLFPSLELTLWRGEWPEPEDEEVDVPAWRPAKFDNYAGWFFQCVGAAPRGFADKIKMVVASFK